MQVRAGIGPGLFLQARLPIQAPLPIAPGPELSHAKSPMHAPSATGPSRRMQEWTPWQLFRAMVPAFITQAPRSWQAPFPICPALSLQALGPSQAPADTLPLLLLHAKGP